MSGFVNSDGSELVGGLNPSNVGQALQVDSAGNLKTTSAANTVSGTSTLTSVVGNASAVALLAANAGRKGIIIYNDSTAILYLGYVVHGSLSTSNYTIQIPSQGSFTMTNPIYTGEISGIWAAANGNARITELS